MNPIFNDLQPSMIRAVNARKKKGDIDLGLGEPILPVEIKHFENAMAVIKQDGCQYGPNSGIEELRSAAINYYQYTHFTSKDNAIVTVGSQEAIYLALKTIINPLIDGVIIIEPSYPAYSKICQLENISYKIVNSKPENNFIPDIDDIINSLRSNTKAILLCNPSNPTGQILSSNWIYNFATKLDSYSKEHNRDIWIISDEVYKELYYTEEKPLSIANIYKNTLVATSLSKSHALTGLRIGFLFGPKKEISNAIIVHQLLLTSSSMFSQHVALSCFMDPSSFSAHRNLYLERKNHLCSALNKSNIIYLEPKGSFYCFIRLDGFSKSSVDIAFYLIDNAGVVTVPGSAFGKTSEHWLRLSWVLDTDKLVEGIERLAHGLNKLKNN